MYAYSIPKKKKKVFSLKLSFLLDNDAEDTEPIESPARTEVGLSMPSLDLDAEPLVTGAAGPSGINREDRVEDDSSSGEAV